MWTAYQVHIAFTLRSTSSEVHKLPWSLLHTQAYASAFDETHGVGLPMAPLISPAPLLVNSYHQLDYGCVWGGVRIPESWPLMPVLAPNFSAVLLRPQLLPSRTGFPVLLSRDYGCLLADFFPYKFSEIHLWCYCQNCHLKLHTGLGDGSAG